MGTEADAKAELAAIRREMEQTPAASATEPLNAGTQHIDPELWSRYVCEETGALDSDAMALDIMKLERSVRDLEFAKADAQRVIGLRDREIRGLKEQLDRIAYLGVKLENDEMLSLQLNISRMALEQYGVKALDDAFDYVRAMYVKKMLEDQRRYR